MFPRTISSAELAVTVLAAPRPLMFLDTAAILDILRAPCRSDVQVDIVESAAAAIEDLNSIPKLGWVVTTANVIREFELNRESVRKELKTYILKLNQSIARLSRVAGIVIPERGVDRLDWLEHTFLERISGIVDRLVASMVVFVGTPECIGKARNRLWAGVPPASRAKQEFKDCEIFEEFLELIANLRAKGFDHPAVFVTPNTRDYGKPPDGHQEIASDLQAAGAHFATNISHARAFVIRAPM